MTPITTTKGSYLVVEVPEGIINPRILNLFNRDHLCYKDKAGWNYEELLPSGYTYTPLFTTQNATEEDWKGVVESKTSRGGAYNSEVGHYQSTGWTTWYKNYLHEGAAICIPNTATESGSSWLIANGYNTSLNHLIIKKN